MVCLSVCLPVCMSLSSCLFFYHAYEILYGQYLVITCILNVRWPSGQYSITYLPWIDEWRDKMKPLHRAAYVYLEHHFSAYTVHRYD